MNIAEEGSYFGPLVSMESVEVGQNSTPAFVMTWSLTHKAVNGQWHTIEPFEAKTFQFLSQGAYAISFEQLEGMGFNGDFTAPELDPIYTEKGTTLVCSHEDYQGKTRERWKCATWGEGSPKALSREKAELLTAKYRQEHAPKPSGKPAAPSVPKTEEPAGGAAPGPDAAPPADDDLPF